MGAAVMFWALSAQPAVVEWGRVVAVGLGGAVLSLAPLYWYPLARGS